MARREGSPDAFVGKCAQALHSLGWVLERRHQQELQDQLGQQDQTLDPDLGRECGDLGRSKQTPVLELEEKAVEHTTSEFTSIRTGKASPALVENLDVHVASYGSNMKLKGLAVITSPEPRMLVVQPFDPSTTGDIDKAIRESKLGLNPVNDGNRLRLPIPELSEERRVELVKSVKGMAEEGRVRIRGVRKDGMDFGKRQKANNELTEDGFHDFEGEVQDLTNKYVKEIDTLVEAKEKEVMTV